MTDDAQPDRPTVDARRGRGTHLTLGPDADAKAERDRREREVRGGGRARWDSGRTATAASGTEAGERRRGTDRRRERSDRRRERTRGGASAYRRSGGAMA